MSNDAIVPGFDEEKCEGLEIRLRNLEGIESGLLVSLAGNVETCTSGCFRRRVARAIDAGFIRLVFDLGGVTCIGGGNGIGTFAQFRKAVAPGGGDIALINLQPRILEVFQLLGFSQFVNVKDNLAEAIGQFRSAGRPPEFPLVFRCPICKKRVRAKNAGRYRCRTCDTILAVDPACTVRLG